MMVDRDLLLRILKKSKRGLESFSLDHHSTTGMRKNVPLWVFIMELLSVDTEGSCVRWSFKMPYEFIITNPKRLSLVWGCFRKNECMTYTKLSRAIRFYYGRGIVEKVKDSYFTYKFVRSPATKSLLERCYPERYGYLNPLLQEPGYIMIHQFMSNNESLFPSGHRSRLNSTASDVSSVSSFVSEDSLFNSPVSTPSNDLTSDSPHNSSYMKCPTSETGSLVEGFSDSGSAFCSPCPTIQVTLKDRIRNYQEEMRRRILLAGPTHQPPHPDMFWLVNPESNAAESS